MTMLFEVADPESKSNVLINFANVTYIRGTDTCMTFFFNDRDELELDISYFDFRDGFFDRYNIKKINVFEKVAINKKD